MHTRDGRQAAVADAVAAVTCATTPGDLFRGTASDPDDRRAARRRWRALVGLVHPDVAAAGGLDAATAAAVTARLSNLWEAWTAAADRAAEPGDAAPHVVGRAGTYRLGTRLRATTTTVTYAADDGTGDGRVTVTVARAAGTAEPTTSLRRAVRRLEAAGLGAFGPDLVDSGRVDGHAWAAVRTAPGLLSVRALRAAVPDGLDGRDWAWIVRRVAMVLEAVGAPHGGLTSDTVLVHPEEHGVVVTGWGEDTDRSDRATADGVALAALTRSATRDGETAQRDFTDAAGALAPGQWLREYDLLLTRLYGPRRYRTLSVPRA
jgi:hypothetical protein